MWEHLSSGHILQNHVQIAIVLKHMQATLESYSYVQLHELLAQSESRHIFSQGYILYKKLKNEDLVGEN